VRRHFARFVYPLRLPFVLMVLFIAAMTSLPADSGAANCPTACEYQYYYDSARTQPAGTCYGACYPGGAWCTGDITDYYKRYACEPCGCWGEQQP
jgi:hypothetical protein